MKGSEQYSSSRSSSSRDCVGVNRAIFDQDMQQKQVGDEGSGIIQRQQEAGGGLKSSRQKRERKVDYYP